MLRKTATRCLEIVGCSSSISVTASREQSAPTRRASARGVRCAMRPPILARGVEGQVPASLDFPVPRQDVDYARTPEIGAASDPWSDKATPNAESGRTRDASD